MKPSTAFLLLLAGGGVLVPLGWKLWNEPAPVGAQAAGKRAPPAVAVEVAPVSVGTIRETVVLAGTLLPRASYTVAAKLTGRLETLTVQIGDSVRDGQVIARVEDAEFRQQVEAAEAEVRVARERASAALALMELARRELERTRILAEKQLISDSSLDAIRGRLQAQDSEHKVASAQLAQKEAALKAAQLRLADTVLKVGWKQGAAQRVVGERFVDPGALLTSGSPILTVLDISTLTAAVHVIERDYARIAPGQAATLGTDAYAGRRFSATVARLAPILSESSRQARVELDVPNPENLLKPGMYVRVEIELSRSEAARLIPRESVMLRGGKPTVFMVGEGDATAALVPIELGITGPDLVEVRSPALEGDVVTVGQHLLKDGAAIKVDRGGKAP